MSRHFKKQYLSKKQQKPTDLKVTTSFVKPVSRIPKLAAAVALEKQKIASTTRSVVNYNSEICQRTDNTSPDKLNKSPQVTLQAKPIEKSASRNNENLASGSSKLSTIKKSASLVSHKVSTAAAAQTGRNSVRNTIDSNIVVKTKVFEVKRNSLYEKNPTSSTFGAKNESNNGHVKINADLKKVVDKKPESGVRTSVTKLPTTTSIQKSSRNSVKNMVSASAY